MLTKRNYFSGLLTGGIVGAILGIFFSSRNGAPRKTLIFPQVGERARRVLHGVSRGMLEMMRR
ncbi:putative membrane protein [Thermacetogenium phaeum DSM 12270]|jgi:gas vesicle protein|uniref:Putative membrane protein n=2 Tax=Thermacetogenium phaeum TaxID=85874 RepID=K4LV80_THEPS|nr:YtxH domain-containing protein [Thermacetogenium phaeum]AFV11929.1 putative membrane protein [Thermacetogenium phaeum DSM 12270]KUK36193.1 MAG: Putative membrane protein [Thermacetogenium phaeum]MDK2881577.1 hypothetical protein [Clostridia bacterium]